MIFNWTETVVLFDLVTDFSDVKRLAPAGWSTEENREYYTVKCSRKELLDRDGRYHHPSDGDVFIDGDDAYGLDFVLSSKRVGPTWDFVLLLHKLIKQPFGPRKSFKAPFAQD